MNGHTCGRGSLLKSNPFASGRVSEGVSTQRLLFILLAAAVCGCFAYGQNSPGAETQPAPLGEPMHRWMILLDEPPVGDAVVDRSELGSSYARDAMRRVLDSQARLARSLAARKIRVIGSTRTILNSMAIMATDRDARDLATLPGVRRIVPSAPVKRAGNRALVLVNAPQAWQSMGGVAQAGLGTRIGIIDTGIDLNHPAFQDDSLPVVSPQCDESTVDCAYTNKKVIAARSYVKMLALPDYPQDSRPDDLSPQDRVGHGTAVAFLAAAKLMDSPIGAIAGVAPMAYLGNYKVFGSPGVNDVTFTDVVAAAVEDALYDGMDVVTLSLSFPAVFGPTDVYPSGCSDDSGTIVDGTPCDPRVEFLQRATKLGLTCVVAAGDEGDSGFYIPSLNTIRSPGTTPEAVTVGATTNSHVLYNSVKVNGDQVPDALKQVYGLFGDGPRPSEPLSAKLVDVSTLGSNGQACTSLPDASLKDAIALIAAGGCVLRTKVQNAFNAGAQAVLFMRGEGNNFVFPPTGLLFTPIPLILVGHDDGQAIRDYLATHPDLTVSLDPTLAEVDATGYEDYIAYFSSYGPSIGTNGIKPDLVAPGSNLFVGTQSFDPQGDMYDALGYTAVQGTSFAVPLVAGAVALSRQLFPDLPNLPQSEWANVLKSSLVNTANEYVYDVDASGNTIYASVTGMGAGKLDVASALQAVVTVDPPSLSFGALSSSNFPVTRTLVFRNHVNAVLQVGLQIQNWFSSSNASMSITPNVVSMQPGALSPTVTVTLGGSAPAPGQYEGALIVYVADSTGYIFQQLQIPFFYIVGDGVPYNLVPVRNFDFVGQMGEPISGGLLFKVVDQYGVPVAHVPVEWRVVSGNGSIDQVYADASGNVVTDSLGISEATTVTLGDRLGEQVFEAEVPNLPTLQFIGSARLRPVLESHGIVNAASGASDLGLAAGSMVTIRGLGLSEFTLSAAGPSLPLSLGGVSVSCDAPDQGVQAPAHISHVSGSRVDIQLPWELQGLPSVLLKVSIDGFTSTSLYTLPIAPASPALYPFTDPDSGQVFVSAFDAGGNRISSANPAQKGAKIRLIANGLGAVENQPASGEPASGDVEAKVKGQISVTVGGQETIVEGARLVAGTVGDYEINVVLPNNWPGSTSVTPVVVTVDGVSSPTVNLPIAQ
jgi:minor extracellular serine protease Vpr